MPSVDSKINRMILEQLKGTPDVRSELVVNLRRAIEENRYYVPEELVAERMICCLAGSVN
jgi:anti-sigma28 factor (negative regulator of flagellin synthesis)